MSEYKSVAGRRGILAAIVAGVCLGGGAAAQERYPARPIKILVASEPGSAPDILARTVAVELAPLLGVAVVIENRAGAAGTIGAAAVAAAPADGYTLLMGGLANMVLAPLLSSARYDPVTGFAPIGMVAKAPVLLVASPALGVGDLDQLRDKIRRRPDGQLSFSSPGVGGPQHLAGVLLQKSLGTTMLHVPYKSGGAAITAVASGQVDLGFVGVPVASSLIEAKKVVPIFIASEGRSPILSQVPTAAEAGIGDFRLDNWSALFGPAHLPEGVIRVLERALQKVVGLPGIKDQFARIGADPTSSTSAELARWVSDETGRWREVIAASGIKVQ